LPHRFWIALFILLGVIAVMYGPVVIYAVRERRA
jgi:hypothetical protein